MVARKYNAANCKQLIESSGEGYTMLDYAFETRGKDHCRKHYCHLQCSAGHPPYWVTIQNWRSGQRCKLCAKVRTSRAQRIGIDKVRELLEAEGYSLHANEYKNSSTKMPTTCPHGHPWDFTWDAWKQGNRCRTCGNVQRGLRRRTPFQEIQDAFAKAEYELRSSPEDYENCYTKLKFVCDKGHTGEITWTSFQSGHRCNRCGFDRMAAGYRNDPGDVQAIFEAAGYKFLTPLSEYKNTSQKMSYRCPNGHVNAMSTRNFKAGYRCPACVESGFNKGDSATLYYVKFDTSVGPLYKIGITNRTFEERFIREDCPYTLIWERHYVSGQRCWDHEQELHRKLKDQRYDGAEQPLTSGNTELYWEDVLELDTANLK